MNIFYLMFIAVIPFPAAILAGNPFLPTAIMVYSATLFFIGLMHFILVYYIVKTKEIKQEAATKEVYGPALRISLVGPACYILAVAGSLIHPYISFCFIVSPLIYYIFFSRNRKVEEMTAATSKKEN